MRRPYPTTLALVPALALLLLAAPATDASAQQARPTVLVRYEPDWPAAAGPAAARQPIPDPVRRYPATHWKTGLAIGGGIGVVSGAVLGAIACGLSETNDTCAAPVMGALVLGGAGAALGALIGGAFPVHPPAEPDTSRAPR